MYKEHRNDTDLPDLYTMLIDSSIDRVMAIDDSWCIIAWNKTSAQITGISEAEILGKPLLEVFPSLQKDQDMMQAIEFAFSGNKSFVAPRMGAFNRQYYENHFIPLTSDAGEVKGVMNIMHDVAHRDKAERKLQQLNEALEQRYLQLETVSTEMATFTYITSIEIKEPLRQIYTSFELLVKSEGHTLSNGGKANIRRMQASLNRINLLLDDITALSEINSFKQQRNTVDLNEVYKGVKIKLEKKTIETQAVINCGPLPLISGYKDMLFTLFTNLIDNGLKFQLPGHAPIITISSRLVEPAELPAGARQQPMWLLSFSDNGIGFEPAQASRIFIMFEKLQPKKEFPGSGMGLAIVKKIIEAHNGYIKAISQPGEGTTMECYFPTE